MPRMSDEVLELAYIEVLRLRERQVARINSLRARSTGILGASGIAASLVSALASNGGYLPAVCAFAVSTMYAVKSMWVQGTTVVHPRGVVGKLIGLDAFDARFELLCQLRIEYDRAEANLKKIVGDIRTAMGWFIAGTSMLAIVSLITVTLEITGDGR